MTRVPELMAAVANVAIGHDCMTNPWYAIGQADMLKVAYMGLLCRLSELLCGSERYQVSISMTPLRPVIGKRIYSCDDCQLICS